MNGDHFPQLLTMISSEGGQGSVVMKFTQINIPPFSSGISQLATFFLSEKLILLSRNSPAKFAAGPAIAGRSAALGLERLPRYHRRHPLRPSPDFVG